MVETRAIPAAPSVPMPTTGRLPQAPVVTIDTKPATPNVTDAAVVTPHLGTANLAAGPSLESLAIPGMPATPEGEAKFIDLRTRAVDRAVAPIAAVRVISLVTDPGKVVKAVGKMANGPVDAALQGKDLVDQGKAVGKAGELVYKGGENVVKNVYTHGLTGGVKATAADAAAAAKTTLKEAGENLSTKTGGGLHNIPASIAKAIEQQTAKAASKGMLEALIKANPELKATGLWSRVTGFFGKVGDVAGKPFVSLMEKLNGGATKLGTWLEKTKVGGPIMRFMDRLNPAAGIAKHVLEEAKLLGHTKGMAQATETVVKALEKTGAKVTVDAAGKITNVVTKTGVEVAGHALEGALKVGAEAAAKEGAVVAGKTAGKGLGRFAPGLNIAIAAYDSAHAVGVWRDPNSTGWQKGMATATAVFSWAAATNIPIVSQVGAVLSIATSVLEHVSPAKIAQFAKNVGGAVVDGAKWVGNKVADGAKAVGRAAVNTVKAVGTGIANGARAVGRFFSSL